MTSRASWLNVSLIKENFKRFWPIMCGGFLFWLVCGPIALVLTKSSEGYSYSFMRSILWLSAPDEFRRGDAQHAVHPPQSVYK